MTQKKRGLGFNPLLGLDQTTVDAVLREQSNQKSDVQTSAGLTEIPVEHIVPNPYQPRVLFSEVELDELADSIKKHGLMQPVVVRKTARGFELIAGERRWRASQRAGLAELPALVRELDDAQVAALALIENLQREQLTAIEQARALARMRDQFGFDQATLAEMISTSRSNVANLLRLLNLSPAVQQLMEQGRLDMGHARALLALPESQQAQLAQTVVDTQCSVRQTEQQVKKLLKDPAVTPGTGGKADPDVSRLETKLSDRLGAKVEIKMRGRGQGQIVIHYSSLDVMDGIVAKLKSKD